MTFRTVLLAVFMVAVPAVALFSHRVPADVRAGAREAVTKAMAWCRDAVLPSGTAATPPAEPIAAATPSRFVPGTPPARMAPGDRPEAVLVRLGATALECRPLPGPHGGHVASCAVALDSEGQLVRMFHGAGGDRDAALTALATEVDAWRNRFPAAGRRDRAGASGVHP